MTNKLTPNMENYLETVLALQEEHGHAHVRDIAEKINIKMPSVTQALSKLKRLRLINYARYSSVTLTPQGKSAAKKVAARHQVLYKFLRKNLGVKDEIAQKDACEIEHVISRQTLEKLAAFVKLH